MARVKKTNEEIPIQKKVFNLIKCNHIIDNYKFQYYCIKCGEFVFDKN